LRATRTASSQNSGLELRVTAVCWAGFFSSNALLAGAYEHATELTGTANDATL